MEQFHLTERQLKEDMTLGMIIKIAHYNQINNQVAKEKEAREATKARQR